MKSIRSIHIFLILLAPGFIQAGGNHQPFPVLSSTDEQESPDIYGNIVVWQQFVSENGDYDIYVADINNPSDSLIQILGGENDQTNPAIFENTIVWQDYVSWQDGADWDISMAIINGQSEPNIFVVSDIANNNEQNPAIHGNIVVWEEDFSGNLNIYGEDITNPENPI